MNGMILIGGLTPLAQEARHHTSIDVWIAALFR
jgi:hypothetical protein